MELVLKTISKIYVIFFLAISFPYKSLALEPFVFTDDFDISKIKIPNCDINSNPPVYDDSFVLAWSGRNNKESYFAAVNNAHKTFSDGGSTVRAFIPSEELSLYNKYPLSNSNDVRDATIRELALAIKEIKTSAKQTSERLNRSAKIAVTVFISNHGDIKTGDQSTYIHGPDRPNKEGQLVDQNISPGILKSIAEQLKDYDVRFINGSCFGSNNSDTFFKNYLLKRSEGAASDSCSCYSDLAEWNKYSFDFGAKIWEDAFVSKPDSTFFEASMRATNNTLNYSYSIKTSATTELLAGNSSMTASEKTLFYAMMKIKDYKSVKSMPPELSDKLFSLSKAKNLSRPQNPKYASVYEKSKLQVETFIRNMNLEPATLALLGFDNSGRIDLNSIKNSDVFKGDEIGRLRALRTLSDAGAEEYKTKMAKLGTLDDAIYTVATKLVREKNQGAIKALEKESTKLQSELADLRKQMAAIMGSENNKIKTAIRLIKRLAMTAEFLNMDDSTDPKLQKYKELFAWYRACELLPLVPRTSNSNNRGPSLSDSGASSKSLNGNPSHRNATPKPTPNLR